MAMMSALSRRDATGCGDPQRRWFTRWSAFRAQKQFPLLLNAL
jgi:hypothetical protein